MTNSEFERLKEMYVKANGPYPVERRFEMLVTEILEQLVNEVFEDPFEDETIEGGE